MHPGPINRGVEIESAVADGPQSVILSGHLRHRHPHGRAVHGDERPDRAAQIDSNPYPRAAVMVAARILGARYRPNSGRDEVADIFLRMAGSRPWPGSRQLPSSADNRCARPDRRTRARRYLGRPARAGYNRRARSPVSHGCGSRRHHQSVLPTADAPGAGHRRGGRADPRPRPRIRPCQGLPDRCADPQRPGNSCPSWSPCARPAASFGNGSPSSPATATCAAPEYAATFDLTVIFHSRTATAEGGLAMRCRRQLLGLSGIPDTAETVATARNLLLVGALRRARTSLN